MASSESDGEIILAVRKYAENPETRIAMQHPAPPLPPLLSDQQLKQAETQLGFQLHPFHSSLLRHVANGGFGPFYGLIGIREGERVLMTDAIHEPDDPEFYTTKGLLHLYANLWHGDRSGLPPLTSFTSTLASTRYAPVSECALAQTPQRPNPGNPNPEMFLQLVPIGHPPRPGALVVSPSLQT